MVHEFTSSATGSNICELSWSVLCRKRHYNTLRYIRDVIIIISLKITYINVLYLHE